MNASYKIALLAAFAVLAIVVSYYAFLAGPPAQEQDPDPNAVVADGNGSNDDNAGNNNPGNTPALPNNGERPPRPAPRTPITTPPAIPGTPGLTPPTTPGGSPAITPGTPTPASPGNNIIIGPQPGENTLGPDTTQDPQTPTPGTPETPTPRVPYPGQTPGGTPGGPSTPGSPEPGPQTPRTPDTPRTPVVEPAPTPPGPAAPRTYTVQPGDTLSAIAVKVFNDEAAWVDIAQANPSVDPLRLQPGQVLIMPAREVVEEAGEPAPPAPGQEQRYTIRPGDNLSRIAERFYDDPDAWQVIYNRNRDKIGPTPDRLKAGMEIIIPPRYEGAN